GHHDRPVRSGGRLTRGDHLRHVVGVAVGLVLLVFLVEMARILAAITRPTLRLFGSGVGHAPVEDPGTGRILFFAIYRAPLSSQRRKRSNDPTNGQEREEASRDQKGRTDFSRTRI